MKTLLIILIALFAIGLLSFIALKLTLSLNEGNAEKYAVANMPKDENSPLKGKNLIFLGSSVTLGFASKHEAIADMIAHKDGANVIKEAVNGTTLVETRSKLGGGESYITRLKRLDKNLKVDALIVQLSTNDANSKIELGKISDSKDISSFNTKTIIGAMEYIIAYAEETWHCPTIIYSGPDFHNPLYTQMNEAVKELQKKWNIGFVDLFDDKDINTKYITKDYISDAGYKPIHPTRKGYQAWLPYFEKEIAKWVS